MERRGSTGSTLSSLWNSLKEESVSDMYSRPPCDLIQDNMHFYGGARSRSQKLDKYEDIERDATGSGNHKTVDVNAKITNLHKDEKYLLGSGYQKQSDSNSESISNELSHYVDQIYNTFDKRDGTIIESYVDIIDPMQKKKTDNDEHEWRRSRRMSVDTQNGSALRRLSLESFSDTVFDIADQLKGMFDSEQSELSFPTRRQENIISCNLVDRENYHETSKYDFNTSKNIEDALLMQSHGSRIVKMKFELASIEGEKGEAAMKIRDNSTIRSHLQTQMLEKYDKLHDKYENLEIEVDQLRESFEALQNETRENEIKTSKAMEEIELFHLIYDTIVNADKENL